MLPRNLGQGERAPPSIAWAAATEARGRRRAIGTDTSNRSTIPPVGAPQKLGDVGDAVPVAVHAIGLRLRQGRGKRPGVAADHAARAGAARLRLRRSSCRSRQIVEPFAIASRAVTRCEYRASN